jgi:hypothetical protein
MTEVEWVACEDPIELLWFRKVTAEQRKLRLFYVACCERVDRLFVDTQSRSALACARRYADGLASARELGGATSEAKGAWGFAIRKAGLARHGEAFDQMLRTSSTGPGPIVDILASDPATIAAAAVRCVVERSLAANRTNAASYAARAVELESGPEAGTRERSEQSTLVRDIFGNPFRPVSFSRSCCTDTVMSLAKQMYTVRDFSAIPILADALQDAGCDSDTILDHCRDPKQVHVRGCWVVDLVLGKK